MGAFVYVSGGGFLACKTSSMIWRALIGVIVGVLPLWLALLLVLWRTKPADMQIRETLRLLPDLLGLLKRLATDSTLPRGVRIRLWLLLGYLLMPLDLVPDFIPVLGYADDAIVVALVLRSVARRAGAEALDRHWRGTPDGLVALRRLARI